MAYRKMTAAEKKACVVQNVENAKATLTKGIENLRNSDGYKAYLDMAATFHTYSYKNTIMILAQRPDATQVAGFKAWQKLGRHVNKGETGIKIWAPNFRKEKDEKTGEEVQKLVGFRLETVFDIGQTDGEALPEIVNKLGGTVEGFETLKDALIEATGITVETFQEADMCGAYGMCDPNTNKIKLRAGMSQAQEIKTLIHEIGHALLHKGFMKDIPRQFREVQAESAAYIVAKHFGIDTGDYSFGYIESWTTEIEIEQIEATIDTVTKAAQFIIMETEKVMAA